MKLVACVIVAAIVVTGCGPSPSYKYPQNSTNNGVQYDDYEVEKCDWDDHPNEPECRGTKKHKKWLAEQKRTSTYAGSSYLGKSNAYKRPSDTRIVRIAKSSKSSSKSKR